MIGYNDTARAYVSWTVDGATTASAIVYLPTYTVYSAHSLPSPPPEPELTESEVTARSHRRRMASFLASLTPSDFELRRPALPPSSPDVRQMVHKKRCFSRCGARRPRVRPV